MVHLQIIGTLPSAKFYFVGNFDWKKKPYIYANSLHLYNMQIGI